MALHVVQATLQLFDTCKQNKHFLSIDSKMMEEDDPQEPKYSSQNTHMQANGNILAAACYRRGNS